MKLPNLLSIYRLNHPVSWRSMARATFYAIIMSKSVGFVQGADVPSQVVGVPVTGFEPTHPKATPAPKTAPVGMVWIPGGEFSMGANVACKGMCNLSDATQDALPIHRVLIDSFWMDATEVTNEQFEKFVKATGYITVAEQKPTQAEFPTASPEDLVAGSIVFTPTTGPVALNQLRWWSYVAGACWNHPTGPDSRIDMLGKQPVVHITYEDALAFAKWAGKRLPTEAEWEFASRGGVTGGIFAWGEELKPGGKFQANIYQGKFPIENEDTGEDGFKGIAPVAQYPPNAYGLFDVAGNVWEWCSDWYRPDSYAQSSEKGGVASNPQGPSSSFDPDEPNTQKRVQRGGSFLCTDQYCTRYILGTRGKGEIRSSSNHIGFRCVISAP